MVRSVRCHISVKDWLPFNDCFISPAERPQSGRALLRGAKGTNRRDHWEGKFVMNPTQSRSGAPNQIIRNLTVILCAVLILPVGTVLWAMQPLQAPASASEDAKISNDQLDSLVAPIALYPDPLLSQTLVACTYPLEIVQLQQFLEKNKELKDKALTDAVVQQNWDPSIQAMAAFPDLVKQLAENIAWTDNLGNAFLAQQSDVMDAVQRMRAKAMQKGALQSSEQQKVETRVVESKTVIVVEPASPEVVYLPSYDPFAIWGSPYYPYPPITYPYAPTGGRLLAFGTGIAIGAAWGNGGWGWNCGWGGGNNNININRNNNFVSHYNSANVGNRYGGANNNWQHNPQHRGGAPYGSQATARQYGGTVRGDNMGQRQGAARQSQGNLGDAGRGFSSGGVTNRPATSPSGNWGGGGDRVGNRQTSSGDMGSRNSSAFSGASTRSAAQASSSRGASSFGGSRGGGFRGGGEGADSLTNRRINQGGRNEIAILEYQTTYDPSRVSAHGALMFFGCVGTRASATSAGETSAAQCFRAREAKVVCYSTARR